MTIKVGINGFGRIGRLVFRCIENRRINGEDIEVVAINDPFTEKKYITYLLRYDSVHSKCDYEIEYDDNFIIVNNKYIKIFSDRNPLDINWKSVDVDVDVSKCFIHPCLIFNTYCFFFIFL